MILGSISLAGTLFMVNAVQINVSRAHCIDGGNAVEKRDFPGTGGPHNTHKLARADGEADILNCFCDISLIPIIFLDLFYI